MDRTRKQVRLIAFDIRPRRFGFVVLEEPLRLVDWGVRRCRSGVRHLDRVMRLVSHFQADVIVLRDIEKGGWRDRPSLRSVMNHIRCGVQRTKCSVVHISDETVKQIFRQYAKPTREEISRLIAVYFPELEWQLPPHRKAWQSERWAMCVFDAAALALAYLSEIDPVAVQELIAAAEPFRRPLNDVT